MATIYPKDLQWILASLMIDKDLMEVVVIDAGFELLKAGFAIPDQAPSMYAAGNNDAKTLVLSGNLDDASKNIMTKLDVVKAKFNNPTQMRFELDSEHHKIGQSLEELKSRMENYEELLIYTHASCCLYTAEQLMCRELF
ncbi:hypothetical protein L1987_34803 [Smallanthus sonchifolius]|uniref:Uncharacterized protein n=1 Tax=Smallanthus sonchifolius TaxID=185202 RepID=A0ACB9HUV6_9ASTR|nr:hypothetical protein L1987_34803 [Smallanthus sonchifolius]